MGYVVEGSALDRFLRSATTPGGASTAAGAARRLLPAGLAGLVAVAVVVCVFAADVVKPVPEAKAAPPVSAPATQWRPDHVVVVVLENKDRESVIGDRDAPYLNELAARGANMTRSYGVTHPSQPNYLAMFYGSQHGVTSNKCRTLGQDNLGTQLLDAGLTFVGYAEDLPRVGSGACEAAGGDYEKKHVPWASSSQLPKATNQPFTAWPTKFDRLPSVAFVIPNMCHDMHDCSVKTGDKWMRKHLDPYARWAVNNNSLLVVTFDENAGGAVNTIATLLVGARVQPGSYREKLNHYGLLRTIQTMYGLPPLGHTAKAEPLRSIWTAEPAPSPPPTTAPSPSTTATTPAPPTTSPTRALSATPEATTTPTATTTPAGEPTSQPSSTSSATSTGAPPNAGETTAPPTPPLPAAPSLTVPGSRGVTNGDFEGGITGWVPVGWVSLVTPDTDGVGVVNAQAGGSGALPGESAFHQTFQAGPSDSSMTVWWSAECRDRRSWAAAVLRDHTGGGTVAVLRPTCRSDSRWRKETAAVQPGHVYTLSLVSHDDVMADARSSARFDDVKLT